MSDTFNRTGTSAQWSLLVVALVVTGCGVPDQAMVDGELDCETEITWSEQGSVVEGTAGLADPGDAVEAYLSPFVESHGGAIEMVDTAIGSLVVDGAEVVVGSASELSAGGWIVLTGNGCDGFDRP